MIHCEGTDGQTEPLWCCPSSNISKLRRAAGPVIAATDLVGQSLRERLERPDRQSYRCGEAAIV
jgi:hypothetical protein